MFPVSTTARVALVSSLICIALTGMAIVGRVASAEDAKPSLEPSGWYVSTVVSSRAGFRVTHYWSKGPKMRSETVLGIHPVITVLSGDRYWAYDALTKEGISVKRSPIALAEDAKRLRPFGNDLESLIRDNGERIDSGEPGETAIETWRVTNGRGRRTVVASATKPKLPLQVQNYDRESAVTATLDYSSWAKGLDLADSFFELPADLSVQTYEYDEFVAKSSEGSVGAVPILHPKLLHGRRPE